jgi:hypothetical protein
MISGISAYFCNRGQHENKSLKTVVIPFCRSGKFLKRLFAFYITAEAPAENPPYYQA